jgi:uncharacterized iron-regulated protein
MIVRVSDGTTISLSALTDELRDVSLVFVGEMHDQKVHHEIQLGIIQALEERGLQVAIGLEMFRRNSQEGLDRWIANEMDDDTFENLYYENWNLPLHHYLDIFQYARERGIPLIGLNVSRTVTRQVARGGFDSLTPEQTQGLAGVTCDVDPAYEAFIRQALGMHGHGDMNFTYFCEAQLVWDTVMAQTAIQYLTDNPGHIMVVLAGNGHAWKRGIPEQVRRRSSIDFAVVLPEMSGRIDADSVSLEDTDYLWLLG